MITGLLAALVSAVCYGVASVLQAVAARSAPRTDGVDPRLLLRLLGRPAFLGGLVLDVVGFAAQFVALRTAPVFLVQAALAAALAVTAIVAVPVLGVRLARRGGVAGGAGAPGPAPLPGSAGGAGAAP